MPDVLSYLSYREFLRDWFLEHHRVTFRAFARNVGCSHALVAAIANPDPAKQRNLTDRWRDPFCRALRFSRKEEAEYFLLLVNYEQARTPAQQQRALEAMMATKHFAQAHRLVKQEYAFLREWYCPAILELVGCEGFKPDPEWIARQLRPTITAGQANRALTLLHDLGLVHRESNGKVAVTHPVLRDDNAQPIDANFEDARVADAARHAYHKWMLTQASRTLSELTKSERLILGQTISLRGGGDRRQVQQRLEQLLREVFQMANESSPGQRVYQVNLQMFPLSDRTVAVDSSAAEEHPPVASLRDVVCEVRQALGGSGYALLPELVSVSGKALPGVAAARCVYRSWLTGDSIPWGPFRHLKPSSLLHDTLRLDQLLTDTFDQAARGVLYLDLGWEDLGEIDELRRSARERGTYLLMQSSSQRRIIAEVDYQVVLDADDLHYTTVDPDIAQIRLLLETHSKAGVPVLLSGETGSGKWTLARVACRAGKGRGLARIRRGQGIQTEQGGWSFYQNVDTLDLQESHLLDPIRLQLADRSTTWRAAARDAPVERPEHPAFDGLVGRNPRFCAALAKAARFAPTDMTVLILGATGTGKGDLADAIHRASGRDGSFFPIDLNEIQPTLVEPALFGQVKWAFTDGRKSRQGAFRQARGGTLFLDEVGNLSLDLQAKLLRALDTGQVRPVGSDTLEDVSNVRIVAATNDDLQAKVRVGAFREDLWHRLSGVVLTLPPLRERGTDILELAGHFMRRFSGSDTQPELPRETERALLGCRWTGNVRQLRDAIAHAVIEAEGRPILPKHLGNVAPSPHPVILSTNATPEELRDRWQHEQELLDYIATVVCRVPPLRLRPRGLKLLLMHLLDGRPIAREVLERLIGRSWWGNIPEAVSVMRVLCSVAGNGPVTTELVTDRLPHLLEDDSAEPIVVLTSATIHQGRIAGLRREFGQAGVLIGRAVRSLHDLEAPKPNVRARLAAIRRLMGTARPGFLPFDGHPRLSRAHLLISRGRDGLVLHRLPHTGLSVEVRGMERPTRLRLKPDAEADLGKAAEIRLLDEDTLYLQLFVFAGQASYSQHTHMVGNRLSAPVESTRMNKGRPPKQRVFRLNNREREVLVELVVAYLESGEGWFSPYLKGALNRARNAGELTRIVDYVPQTSDGPLYLKRLIQYQDPDAFGAALDERIAAAGLTSECGRLPKWLRQMANPRLSEETSG